VNQSEATLRAELLDKKTALVNGVHAINAELSAVKNKINSSGHLPKEEYRKLCSRQSALIADKNSLESQLHLTKAELSKLADRAHASKPSNGESAPIVRELVALRQKYQEFAADGTRVSSMRKMAAEFVLELNPLIKGAIRLAAKEKESES